MDRADYRISLNERLLEDDILADDFLQIRLSYSTVPAEVVALSYAGHKRFRDPRIVILTRVDETYGAGVTRMLSMDLVGRHLVHMTPFGLARSMLRRG
jgi:hypothetical protein